jgi:hypothetical protein
LDISPMCRYCDLRYHLAGPVVTDNGNFIIDAPFDLEQMKTPYTVSGKIPVRHLCPHTDPRRLWPRSRCLRVSLK